MINWKTQIWKQLCAKCGALSHICCFQCFTHTQKHKHRAERGGSISGPCFFFDLLLSGCVDLRLIPPLRCSSSFPCLPPARVAQMSPLFTADREGRANEVLATRKLLSCMFHLPHAVQFTLVSQDIRLHAEEYHTSGSVLETTISFQHWVVLWWHSCVGWSVFCQLAAPLQRVSSASSEYLGYLVKDQTSAGNNQIFVTCLS